MRRWSMMRALSGRLGRYCVRAMGFILGTGAMLGNVINGGFGSVLGLMARVRGWGWGTGVKVIVNILDDFYGSLSESEEL